MKLKLIALGHNQPGWVNDGVAEYAKRFPAEWPFELAELKPEKRAANRSTEIVLATEAGRIRAQIPRQALVVALDRGQKLSEQSLGSLVAFGGIYGERPDDRLRHRNVELSVLIVDADRAVGLFQNNCFQALVI